MLRLVDKNTKKGFEYQKREIVNYTVLNLILLLF